MTKTLSLYVDSQSRLFYQPEDDVLFNQQHFIYVTKGWSRHIVVIDTSRHFHIYGLNTGSR